MRRLQIIFTLCIIALAGCKGAAVVDPIIINAVSPTITGFSQDTVWTFARMDIYGTNFGYDPRDVPVRIDTAEAEVVSVADTVMTVIVPEYARTGFVYVTKLKQTGKSPKRLNINYSFTPHGINDSVPLGGYFSIHGTGLSNHKGLVKILVNGIQYPVDSIFDDRIVSHVVANGSSGQVFVSDDAGYGHDAGYLYVTRYCMWNTVTATWDHLVMSEHHHRTGYLNGPGQPVDSTWTVTTTYNFENSWNLNGAKFARTERGLNFDVPLASLGIRWDTVSHSLVYNFETTSTISATNLHSKYLTWYVSGGTMQTQFPVDHELDIPVMNFRNQAVEDSTDQTGVVKFHEVTDATPVSGLFHIHFAQ